MHKRKICIVGPAIKMGGVERSSVNLANGLNLNGISVTYIAIFKQAHFLKLNEGVKFIEPKGFNCDRLSFFKTLFYLRQSIKNENFDAVIAFTKFYSALVLLSLFGTKIRVYITERSSPFYRWPLKINIIGKLALYIKKPSGIIAQTTIASIQQKKNYGHGIPIVVIPNALKEIKLYPEVLRQKIILAVGRLNDASKGFDRLVYAFSKIKNPDWTLVFAGGDEEGEHIKQLALSLGISKRVIFLGKIESIDKLYAKAGLFVIPSRSEGFPNALCEAMAAGLPCISFDFMTGPREIITHGENGYIVEDGNIIEMANMIQFLIDNEKERNRIGTNALVVREKYRLDAIVNLYVDFIYS